MLPLKPLLNTESFSSKTRLFPTRVGPLDEETGRVRLGAEFPTRVGHRRGRSGIERDRDGAVRTAFGVALAEARHVDVVGLARPGQVHLVRRGDGDEARLRRGGHPGGRSARSGAGGRRARIRLDSRVRPTRSRSTSLLPRRPRSTSPGRPSPRRYRSRTRPTTESVVAPPAPAAQLEGSPAGDGKDQVTVPALWS